MSETREPVLPGGISDLYDLVQRKEEAERQLRKKTSLACRWLVPLLIEKLSVTIDYDSIRLDEKDIVLPLIREAAVQELHRITGELSHDSSTTRMLDFLTEETWLEMLHHGENPIHRNLTPAELASRELALREFQSDQRKLEN
jgi:hypothetical protein